MGSSNLSENVLNALAIILFFLVWAIPGLLLCSVVPVLRESPRDTGLLAFSLVVLVILIHWVDNNGELEMNDSTSCLVGMISLFVFIFAFGIIVFSLYPPIIPGV